MPLKLKPDQIPLYTEEADLLHVALFKTTAKDWRMVSSAMAEKKMNVRDMASINELAILSNSFFPSEFPAGDAEPK